MKTKFLLETCKDVISQINTKKSLKIPRSNQKKKMKKERQYNGQKKKDKKRFIKQSMDN